LITRDVVATALRRRVGEEERLDTARRLQLRGIADVVATALCRRAGEPRRLDTARRLQLRGNADVVATALRRRVGEPNASTQRGGYSDQNGILTISP
jgi:Arc/MetJ family transcription regulator